MQSLQKSRNLSLPYQLLSVLTAMLLTLEQNKSRVVDHNKTKTMLLIPDEKKHLLMSEKKQKPFCWCWNKTKAI